MIIKHRGLATNQRNVKNVNCIAIYFLLFDIMIAFPEYRNLRIYILLSMFKDGFQNRINLFLPFWSFYVFDDAPKHLQLHYISWYLQNEFYIRGHYSIQVSLEQKYIYSSTKLIRVFIQNAYCPAYFCALSADLHCMCAKYLMNIPIISASTHQLKFADFAIFTASCIWDKGIFSTILKLSIKTS